MQISQKLFNQQAINNFAKLDAEIQKIQEQVSTGKNILSASDDPVNAVNLSVANEQKELLQRYTENADAADARLSLADVSIQEAVNTLRRITELSIQAGSGTVNETAILKEIDALKEVVVEIANNRDAQGQAVFSGFKTNIVPFLKELDGSVNYVGDRGQHTVQISESMKVKTSIDGGTTFMAVPTGSGVKSVFEIIDNARNAVKTASQFKRQGSATGHAELNLVLPPDPQEWTFSLVGSKGGVSITSSIAEGKVTNLVAEINKNTEFTGITATENTETGAITLKENFAGEIVMKDIKIKGTDFGTDDVTSYVRFDSYDGMGNLIGATRHITDTDQLIASSVNFLENASSHLGDQLAVVGANMNKLSQQKDILAERQILVTEKIGDLGDADLAELITRLQALILSKDASQATFSKIGQQTLFDFIR